ncbi:MAG: carbohydrate ABC transporter permease [Actinomycetota bacterium]
MRRSRAGRIARGAVIAVMLTWSLGPILLGALTSVSTQAEAQAGQWLPTEVNLSGYRALLSSGGSDTTSGFVPSEIGAFGHAMLNSVVITLETTAVLLVLAVTAGYAFARLRFPGRRMMFGSLVATLIVPALAVIVPLWRVMADLHLIGTQMGLLLIYVSANAPLAVWLMYIHARELPISVEEAALSDGCTRFQAFRLVVLPQMWGGIAAVTAIMALSVWGEFFIPLLFAPTASTKPVTVLITEFVGKYTTNQPLLAAAGILTLVPPAVLAIVLSRRIRGLLSGWHG